MCVSVCSHSHTEATSVHHRRYGWWSDSRSGGARDILSTLSCLLKMISFDGFSSSFRRHGAQTHSVHASFKLILWAYFQSHKKKKKWKNSMIALTTSWEKSRRCLLRRSVGTNFPLVLLGVQPDLRPAHRDCAGPITKANESCSYRVTSRAESEPVHSHLNWNQQKWPITWCFQSYLHLRNRLYLLTVCPFVTDSVAARILFGLSK